MAGYGQGGQPPLLKADFPVPCRLRSIQCKGYPIFPADLSHCGSVLNHAADIGPMGQEHQPGVGANPLANLLRVQPSGPIAGNPVKSDALARQIPERPHDRVMLHSADQAVAALPQPAAQDHVQPHGISRRQHTMGRTVVAKQPAQAFSEQEGGHARFLCRGIHPPVDRGPHFLDIVQHGFGNRRGLWERGGGVVQIDHNHSSLDRVSARSPKKKTRQSVSFLVDANGLEPLTPCTSSRCSSQLS